MSVKAKFARLADILETEGDQIQSLLFLVGIPRPDGTMEILSLAEGSFSHVQTLVSSAQEQLNKVRTQDSKRAQA